MCSVSAHGQTLLGLYSACRPVVVWQTVFGHEQCWIAGWAKMASSSLADGLWYSMSRGSVPRCLGPNRRPESWQPLASASSAPDMGCGRRRRQSAG